MTTGRSRWLARPALLVVVVLALAACGGSGGTGPVPSDRPPASSTGSAPPTPPSTPPQSPPQSSSPPVEQSLSGVIIEGIRPTCRILQTHDRRYALTGPGTEPLLIGQRVVVTGTARPDLVSPCGSTFVVATISSAPPSTSAG